MVNEKMKQELRLWMWGRAYLSFVIYHFSFTISPLIFLYGSQMENEKWKMKNDKYPLLKGGYAPQNLHPRRATIPIHRLRPFASKAARRGHLGVMGNPLALAQNP